VALLVVVLACTRRAPIADSATVPQVVSDTLTMVGVLDVVVGDPIVTSEGERVRAAIVDSSGKRTPLLLLRAQLDALGAEARRPGVRVRVTGQPTTLDGVAAVRVIAITLAQ
jgi:hypothetical protein